MTNLGHSKQKKEVKTLKRWKKKFELPYPTYHYRNLLWKVNYSNKLYVQPPLEYEHRLKVYVGRGNNSCMVAGLIGRRPWFAFTDKLQEANFAWTQLKQLPFLRKQQSSKTQIEECKGGYNASSLFRDVDEQVFKNYLQTYQNAEEKADERMFPRNKYFKYDRQIKSTEIREHKMHNHLINNYVLGNKKALFNTMANYYHSIQ